MSGHCCPINSEDMDLVFVAVAFASMDAGAEPTRTYLRRATAANTEFMSSAIAMGYRTNYVLHRTS